MSAQHEAAVSLSAATAVTWQQALQAFELGVLPSQQHFVSEHSPIAAVMLAKAYVRPAGLTWMPFFIYQGERVVGMLQLVYGSDEDSDCWLYHFFIDHRFQGRGLGSAAVRALLAHLKTEHPGCSSVFLTVHPDNHVAQKLYAGHGFTPTGAERDGEPVYRLGLR